MTARPSHHTRFAAYGEEEAFFVSTGVNFLYILYGGLILYPRMILTDKVTPEMTRLPKASSSVDWVGLEAVCCLTSLFCIYTDALPHHGLAGLRRHLLRRHGRVLHTW
jgi:hypothetical protein